jgi:hypothetical protein
VPPGSGCTDPDVRIRILLSSYKNSEKNLGSYYFVTLFDFLYMKNDVKIASKSKKQKKLCSKLRSISQRHGSADPDPDPAQNVMDPQN